MSQKYLLFVTVVLLLALSGFTANGSTGQADNPNPAHQATGVSTVDDLTWSPGDYAVSHDVYLGTNLDEVNNAGRFVGDVDGDGWVDFNDVLELADNWLQEPNGSEPSVDLNDDGDVDLVDYAIVAFNWLESDDGLFKGRFALDANSFYPYDIEVGQSYHWRIDEVNDCNSQSPWKGGPWSFTVTRLGIHLLPHEHFDLDWPQVASVQINTQNTHIKQRLEYMRSGSTQTYTFDGACTLRHFLQAHPEELDYLKQMVQEGRIDMPGDITGCEMTMSQGESVVRDFVLGKVLEERLLGISTESPFGWYIDNYGLVQQLPQIMKKSERELFVIGDGYSVHTPFNPNIDKKADFVWEGIDGSRIRTHRQPYYGISVAAMRAQSAAVVLMNIQGLEGCGPIPLDWEQNQAAAMEANPSFPRSLMSTPRKYIERMGDSSELPVAQYNTWLGPSCTGCYESHEKIRQGLRRCENLLEDTEKFATMAYLLGQSYPEQVLDDGWERTLWNAHHDSILGCVNDESIANIMQRNTDTVAEVEPAYYQALDAVASDVNTESGPAGQPVIVFNPCSWDRTEVVEIDWANVSGISFTVKDTNNTEMPVQVDEQRSVLIFTASDIPSLGYKTFFVTEESGQTPGMVDVNLSNGFMETSLFKVSFSESGISEILHKPSSYSLTATGAPWMPGEIFAQEDHECGCRISAIVDPIQGKPPLPVTRQADQQVDIRLIENGPARKTAKLTFDMFGSPFVQHVHIYEDVDRVDFVVDVDWSSEQQRFRVAFPTDISSGKVFSQEAFAITEGWVCTPWISCKPVNQWMEYAESNGTFGAAVVNHGTHHCYVVDDAIEMTLFKSGKKDVRCDWCWPVGDITDIEETGEHNFRYSLILHADNWKQAGVNRRAYAVNHPVCPRTSWGSARGEDGFSHGWFPGPSGTRRPGPDHRRTKS